jgi:hypothetical protein
MVKSLESHDGKERPMQQVASYTTAGGQTKHVMWDEGRFSVNGYEIALGDVLSWDENGLLT